MQRCLATPSATPDMLRVIERLQYQFPPRGGSTMPPGPDVKKYDECGEYEPGDFKDAPHYTPTQIHYVQFRPTYSESDVASSYSQGVDSPSTASFDISLKNGMRKKKKVNRMSGLGEVLNQLRFGPSERRRIVLDERGRDVAKPSRRLPHCAIGEAAVRVLLADEQGSCDLPAPPPHPTEVHEVRKLIRSKMLRCKRCKNRFVERNLYERHLQDKHPADWVEYAAEQEAEMEQQRLEELEANRIEELTTGGFIPPADEIAAENFAISTDGIPLPGETNGGIVPRFDIYGGLKALRRPYRKKVSPQCPFCDKRFRNEYSLRKHFAKKHPECIDFVQCHLCFKSLPSKADLETHDCEMSFVCFECTPIRNLCTDIRLLNHRKKFHRGANSGFRCNLCNLKFLTPRKLRKHKKMSHVFTKTFQCHFCEEIFISEVAVMTHERVHTGIIKFECRICDFKANRYTQMEEHNKSEHGYLCAICQEKYSEWAEMKNHTLAEHGGYLTNHRDAGYIESPRVWIMFKGE